MLASDDRRIVGNQDAGRESKDSKFSSGHSGSNEHKMRPTVCSVRVGCGGGENSSYVSGVEEGGARSALDPRGQLSR